MKLPARMYLWIILLLTNIYVPGKACIVIGQPDGFILRNMDFPIGGKDALGLITYSPKDYHRSALKLKLDECPLNWTAKFPTVTLSLLAPGFPQDGMNAAGLLGSMTVIRGRYHSEGKENFAHISEMELLQFVLDQAQDVKDVVSLLVDENQIDFQNIGVMQFSKAKVRIRKLTQLSNDDGETNFHWVFCDTSNRSVMIDLIKDQIGITLYATKDLILTNEDTDLLSQKYDRVSHVELPVMQETVTRSAALRYYNARYFREEKDDCLIKDGFVYDYTSSLSYEEQKGFYILSRTAPESWNKWQVVYDINARKILYRTKYSEKVHMISVQDIFAKFLDSRETRVLSMHSKGLLDFEQGKSLLEYINVVRKDLVSAMLLMGHQKGLAKVAVAQLKRMEELNQDLISRERFVLELFKEQRNLNDAVLEKASMIDKLFAYMRVFLGRVF